MCNWPKAWPAAPPYSPTSSIVIHVQCNGAEWFIIGLHAMVMTVRYDEPYTAGRATNAVTLIDWNIYQFVASNVSIWWDNQCRGWPSAGVNTSWTIDDGRCVRRIPMDDVLRNWSLVEPAHNWTREELMNSAVVLSYILADIPSTVIPFHTGSFDTVVCTTVPEWPFNRLHATGSVILDAPR